MKLAKMLQKKLIKLIKAAKYEVQPAVPYLY